MDLRWDAKALIYGAFGWAIEIIFTGVFNAIDGDISATGQTYLWMFPVWGLGCLIFEKVALFLKYKEARLWLRVFVYTLGLVSVEYLAGAVIQKITGTIPWDYSLETTHHLHGLVRYDYLPFWALCGMVLEQFTFIVDKVRW